MLGRDNMRRYSIANLCSDSSTDSESGYASYGSAYRNTVTGYDIDPDRCSDINPDRCPNSSSYIDSDRCSDINPDRCPNSSSYSGAVRLISYGAGSSRACKQ